MDEVVKFANSQVRFELTSRRPGDPAPLAATFREQCACPADVMMLAMGMAA